MGSDSPISCEARDQPIQEAARSEMQDDKCAGSAEERELSRVQVLWLQGVQSASKQLPTGVCRSGLVSGVGECRRRRRRRRRCVVKEAQDNGLSVVLYQLQITIIVRLSGLGSVGRQQKWEISSRTLGVTTNCVWALVGDPHGRCLMPSPVGPK